MAKTLAQMQDEVYRLNVSKGWFETERTVGDSVALLHSEVSEMFEQYREIGLASRDQRASDHMDCPAPYDLAPFNRNCTCSTVEKPDDFASELADVLIRVYDTAYRYGIDLEFQFERKMRYNHTRPERHGGKRL